MSCQFNLPFYRFHPSCDLTTAFFDYVHNGNHPLLEPFFGVYQPTLVNIFDDKIALTQVKFIRSLYNTTQIVDCIFMFSTIAKKYTNKDVKSNLFKYFDNEHRQYQIQKIING